jgi:hypothetical protein
MTKKILLGLACALVVAPMAMAGSAAPRAMRTYGDQGNDGAIFSIGSVALVGHPDCDAGGGLTINGAAYAGAIGTFDLIGGDPSVEDDYIHDMSAFAVFSADDFLDEDGNLPSGDLSLDLNSADNFGITYQLHAGTVSDGLLREVLQALGAPRGPFGAGFSRPTNMMTESRDTLGDYLGGTTITFAPAIQDASIALGGNGGTLNACLGPTGQVRIIDADNNNFDEDCGNWRATTIEVGNAGLRTELEAALERDSILTCDVSCAGGGPTNTDCDNEITSPFAVSITAGNMDMNRWQQWMVLEGFLFGFIDNIVVLGGDPTEPSSIAISW